MATISGNLDHWRRYFESIDSNIFDIIKHGIEVAALDYPTEFRNRRDQITKKLYSYPSEGCNGCYEVEVEVLEGEGNGGFKSGFEGCSGVSEVGEGNFKKVNSSSSVEGEMKKQELKEESFVVGEVLRLKEVLSKSEEQSEEVVLKSLIRLQLIVISMQTLKETEIGKVVNPLRKHKSKTIHNFARTLFIGWKNIVDEWIKSTSATTDAESSADSIKPSSIVNSMNPSIVEEEVIPSPPFEKNSVKPSSIVDFMEPFIVKKEIIPCPSLEKYSVKPSCIADSMEPSIVEEEVIPCPPLEEKALSSTLTNSIDQSQKSMALDEDPFLQLKLESVKKKLCEGYQHAKNVKKQRTVQILELNEIPMMGFDHKNVRGSGGCRQNYFNGRH